MSWRRDYRDLFLRYLAGELSEQESRRVEERLLADDNFFDRMEEAQNDLLDAYAAGELSESQRKTVEAVLQADPAQQRRLRLARGLAHMGSPTPMKARATAGRSGRKFYWGALLALACAVIAVVTVLYVRSRSPVQRRLAAQKANGPTMSAPGSASQTTRPPQPASPPAHTPAFALLLSPSVERGSNSNQVVTLPPGLRSLEVQILLPRNESGKRYDVQITFPQGAGVKTLKGLTLEEAFSERLVRFQLPATGLPTGLYVFRLYRENGKSPVLAASYQALIHSG